MLFKNVFIFILVKLLIVLPSLSLAATEISTLPPGLTYESRKSNNHVIHILTIDPKKYRLHLVKAHSSVFGRETVPVTARRTGAIAAINAGFFEIGHGEDGRPSGTLVIDGEPLSLARRDQDLLILQDKKLNILNGRFKVSVTASGQPVGPDTVNRFITNDQDVVLYNHLWARSTLTPHERREVLIDRSGTVLKVVEQGDNVIPELGWVLSFPRSKPLGLLKPGLKLKFDFQLNSSKNQDENLYDSKESIVAGIPTLLEDGKLSTHLTSFLENGAFAQPHARSAIGFKENGSIVMVLAEHHYTQEFGKITLKEAQSVIQSKNFSKEEYAALTLPVLVSTLQNEFSKQSGVVGLTLVELANVMLDLKCIQAINLDGGGSSTLFLNGEVVNAAFGDQDEALGQRTLRPVSNSLVVLKRD